MSLMIKSKLIKFDIHRGLDSQYCLMYYRYIEYIYIRVIYIFKSHIEYWIFD